MTTLLISVANGKNSWHTVSIKNEWGCKENFKCSLTDGDVNKNVLIRLVKDDNLGKMIIDCQVRDDCTVELESTPNPENSRPFYLIAHRCNDNEDVGIALSGGCNAVECDLQFNQSTNEIFVNHDNANGTTLSEWLSNAKKLADQHPDNFALIIFDCKFAGEYDHDISANVLKQVREKVRATLTNSDNPMNVLFSVAKYANRNILKDIGLDLLPNEGISIDQFGQPELVEAYFKSINAKNVWYGNGIFTFGIKPNIYSSMEEASKLRENNRNLKKIYVWTLRNKRKIKEYIEIVEVDGVMVNVPGTITGFAPSGLQAALNVISKSDKIRMAKRSDNAFSVFEKEKN